MIAGMGRISADGGTGGFWAINPAVFIFAGGALKFETSAPTVPATEFTCVAHCVPIFL